MIEWHGREWIRRAAFDSEKIDTHDKESFMHNIMLWCDGARGWSEEAQHRFDIRGRFRV
ncbi:hypothetical protein [Rubritalea tangerina]|uniref:hypothetical protein n=1 Tax=Rubritalea tangerina TaxID=430798 RepID=UPI0036167977